MNLMKKYPLTCKTLSFFCSIYVKTLFKRKNR